MSEKYDVVVIGLGAVGAATLYQLARRGARVLGIDRFAPPHDRGSSHGETRITRTAIGEGEVYCNYAIRSHTIWRELEAETGQDLLLECGFMAIDTSGGASIMHGRTGFVDRTAKAALAYGIRHERLTPAEARYRYPGLDVPEDAQLCYEPGGGLVFPERCIAAQLATAGRLGAVIRTDEPVTGIEVANGSVTVSTSAGRYAAARAVLAAGGWTPGLAGDGPMRRMRLLRQVLHWFDTERPDRFAPQTFPTFIWTHGATAADSFYGFPMVPGHTPGVKVATEQYEDEIGAPELLSRTVTPDESAAMHRDHVSGRLAGVSAHALKSVACFYTQSPDSDFVIGAGARGEELLMISACSGHGFKHSAGMGELVARSLVENIDIPAEFSPLRAELAA